jgi:hypothetical protein
MATKLSIVDRLFKGLDHNRYTAIAASLGVTLVSFAGCQVTATSPYTNQPATRDQIELQRIDFEREQLLAKAKRESDAKRRIDAITTAAAQEIAEITSDIEFAGQSDEAAKARLEAQAELAKRDIERRENAIVDALDFVNTLPVIQANPALATAISLATTALFGGAMLDNRRKDKVIAKKKGDASGSTEAA